jgi:hypothetical protein
MIEQRFAQRETEEQRADWHEQRMEQREDGQRQLDNSTGIAAMLLRSKRVVLKQLANVF